ncbi:MAG: cation-translocating P-type ATPase [Polaromonas sp.]|uniref:heavy metal translocating P-type ATPase n=1 Tax=Polaromonas sp. TaxID=1869339 RepID=UPI00272F9ABB|nr:cation-translocating P-type ATPase [Polaromonas sp.]MDP2452285.1 cation-translocating P-type ATPase [Polaromonas sp.]MDP3245888.1 cation-translocating P-type ATPase [Polaromonas sp.]MDP3754185.1 cation-translocating P-type ATPase [Polaromonas sp.]
MHTATLDTGAAQQALRWSALDERAEWEGFSRPLPGRADLWESYLAIEGMHCAACSLTVEEVLQKLPGVDNVQVNGASAVARVAWAPGQGRPSAWLAALQRAGYGALPAGDMLAAAPRIQAQRMMLWRWLVAGFCMMQVMMYAFPAYIAEPGDISSEAQGLLRWASWVLTLPVVLFSCWPFFSSALRDLRNRRVGMDVPVALGILIAFGASSAATFDPASRWGAEVWYDSVTMFVFFLLSGRLLEQRLRDRTAGSLEALMRSLPDGVERQGADGTFERVAVRRLVPGDLIRLLPGDVIPADGTVTAGESQVDEALLTGESTPLQRRVGSAVIAGSHNLNGMLLVRVERAGSETRYAAMVALMEQASVQKPRLARIADRIAGPFVVMVLLASAAAALWWWPTDPVHAISVAVAVLIVTCPCALSLATPAATLAAAGALARRGVLVRRLEALESCAMVDTVVFDKTGTLTEDRMAVTVSRTREGTPAAQVLSLAAALAQHSLHPLSRAIVQAAGSVPESAVDVTEVSGQGLQGHVATGTGGKPHAMRLGSAAFCGAPADVQAAGGPQVHLSDEQGWLASFEMDEALRPDARPAVGALHALGLQVQLLSGDLMAAVTRLAARAGIDKAFGQRTPEGKLAYVRELQQQGRRVAMVGDGMNDGPVLACADVSVAMGQAVPLAQAKSDFIVLGGQLAAVSALLQHARRTRAIVRQNLLWAALYNAVCVPLAILGFMPPWLAGLGMAASSLLVVLNSARLARMPG